MSRLRDENEQVTAAYQEMEERYRPFLEQFDSLEDLNKLLKSQTSLAQSEAEKFGELYAKVLGHQNHKQKIQYVKKLREENMGLKQVRTKDIRRTGGRMVGLVRDGGGGEERWGWGSERERDSHIWLVTTLYLSGDDRFEE